MSFLNQLARVIAGTEPMCEFPEACTGCTNCYNLNIPNSDGDGWLVEYWKHPDTCHFAMDWHPSGQEGADNRNVRGGTNSNCNLGCFMCDDTPTAMIKYGVSNVGFRFLMKYQRYTMEQAYRQHRDAHGMVHDLKSNEPRRIQAPCSYMLAPVWSNSDGDECVTNACEHTITLAPTNVFVGETNHCAHGESAGERMMDHYPDAFRYGGYRAPNYSDDMAGNLYMGNLYCRQAGERTVPTAIKADKEYLYQTIFLRSGIDGSNCVSNALVGAKSKVLRDPGQCDASIAWDVDEWGEPKKIYYNDNAIRQRFSFVHIKSNTARFIENSEHDRGIVTLKNAVLSHIANEPFPVDGTPPSMNFQQLGELSPGDITGYQTVWNYHPFTIPCDSLPVVQGLNFAARLRGSKETIPVELVFTEARIESSVVLHKVNHRDAVDPISFAEYEEPRIYPHTRVKITGKLAVRLVEPVESVLSQPWLPVDHPDREIPFTVSQSGCYEDEDDEQQRLPVVQPETEEIEYVVTVNGAECVVDVPDKVEWWGCLNSFSNPSVDDQMFLMYEGSQYTQITAWGGLADGFDHIRIPGWTTHSDSFPDNPSKIYAGELELSFP